MTIALKLQSGDGASASVRMILTECVMKKLLLASVGLVALGVASASAADLPRREAMPTKAPAYVSQMYNWTGAYVGINGGYGFNGSNGADGWTAGGTVGYNWQSGGPLVWGIEGDLNWSDINGSDTALTSTSNNWLVTAVLTPPFTDLVDRRL